jgi:hypothetical protein
MQKKQKSTPSKSPAHKRAKRSLALHFQTTEEKTEENKTIENDYDFMIEDHTSARNEEQYSGPESPYLREKLIVMTVVSLF